MVPMMVKAMVTMMKTMMVITMVRAPMLTNDVQTWARHPSDGQTMMIVMISLTNDCPTWIRHPSGFHSDPQGNQQGSLFLVYRGETSLLKTPYFQQTYKKLSQFYKNLRSDMLRSPPNLIQHKGLRRLKCHLTTNCQTNKEKRYQLQHS